MTSGENLRPRHRTPAVVIHLVHPLHKDPKVGKWCEVLDEDGNRIFEGLFQSCWRLVNNLRNSEVTECGELFIEEIEYNPTTYIPIKGDVYGR